MKENYTVKHYHNPEKDIPSIIYVANWKPINKVEIIYGDYLSISGLNSTLPFVVAIFKIKWNSK